MQHVRSHMHHVGSRLHYVRFLLLNKLRFLRPRILPEPVVRTVPFFRLRLRQLRRLHVRHELRHKLQHRLRHGLWLECWLRQLRL